MDIRGTTGRTVGKPNRITWEIMQKNIVKRYMHMSSSSARAGFREATGIRRPPFRVQAACRTRLQTPLDLRPSSDKFRSKSSYFCISNSSSFSYALGILLDPKFTLQEGTKGVSKGVIFGLQLQCPFSSPFFNYFHHFLVVLFSPVQPRILSIQ